MVYLEKIQKNTKMKKALTKDSPVLDFRGDRGSPRSPVTNNI